MSRIARRRGILAVGERFLNSPMTGLIAFAVLLTTINITTLQAILLIVVFVQRTTEPPEWLKREREAEALSND